MIERNKPSGMVRLLHAFGHSMRGFVGVYQHEAAFRQELLLAFLDLVEGIGTNFAVPTRAVHVKEGAYTTSAPGRRD